MSNKLGLSEREQRIIDLHREYSLSGLNDEEMISEYNKRHEPLRDSILIATRAELTRRGILVSSEKRAGRSGVLQAVWRIKEGLEFIEQDSLYEKKAPIIPEEVEPAVPYEKNGTTILNIEQLYLRAKYDGLTDRQSDSQYSLTFGVKLPESTARRTRDHLIDKGRIVDSRRELNGETIWVHVRYATPPDVTETNLYGDDDDKPPQNR